MKDSKFFKLTVFLLLVSGLSAFLIAYVNAMTFPIIEEQRITAIRSGYKEIYPDADEFIETDYQAEGVITAVVLAKDQSQDAGVIYTVAPSGYNDSIEILVAFDIATQKITGIKILTQTETAGLGANCIEPWYTARYAGKSAREALVVVKIEPTVEQEVQALTAATITSVAITDGINIARENFITTYTSN